MPLLPQETKESRRTTHLERMSAFNGRRNFTKSIFRFFNSSSPFYHWLKRCS